MSPTRSPLARFLVTTALATLAAGTVLAGPGSPHERHRGAGGHDDGMFLLDRLEYRLELTEDQVAQVRGFHEARKPALEALHERMVPARSLLFDAIHAETIDTAAVAQASASVAAIEAEFNLLRAEMYQQLRSILTEEQRIEASEMLDEMRAYREDHPGGFLPRRHGPHHGGSSR
jgi:Spy/CpxP family protein refolding chaperone